MTDEELKEQLKNQRIKFKSDILNIYHKGFLDETDKKTLWEVYKQTLGQFPGNLNCQDCIRDAIRKLIIEFTND
jgi:hypothetical protein